MPPTEPAQDALFAYIEDRQGNREYGSLLDAGTGYTSLGWVLSLPTRSWTAVTGESARATYLRSCYGPRMRAQDQLLVGNWSDPLFLACSRYDCVLADYLLGAVDRYAPYFQERLLERLRRLTQGRLYLVGLEPYPVPVSAGERAVVELAQFRDACILHAGQRPHREYPMQWTLARLEAVGFQVLDCKTFPILYGPRFVKAELDLALKTIAQVADKSLQSALRAREKQLRARALATHRESDLACGFDYVIVAQ